jgi:transposase
VVATFYRAEVFPERTRRSVWERALIPFQVHLQVYWDHGGRNAMQAWRDVQALGFKGSRHVIARWFRQCREQPEPSTPKRYLTPEYQQARQVQTTAASSSLPLTPKDLAWWMVSDPKTPSPSERRVVVQLQLHPVQNRLFTLVREFVQNLRERNWQRAEAWLTDCENSQLPTLVNFAKGLRQEQSAFVASLRESWSNGPVEGHITRLKLLKRQMYGRAKLDLLRIRFLTQTSPAGHQI